MILLLNLSIEPFFISTLSDEGDILLEQELPNDRTVGNGLFQFLEAQHENLKILPGSEA